MTILFYAFAAIVVINIFAAAVYNYLHRGAGLAISLVGTILIVIGLAFATLNDVPASEPAQDITTPIETTSPTPAATTTPDSPRTIHPSLIPSPDVSRETAPAPAARPTTAKPQHTTQKKAPIIRKHFDDMEKQLSHTGKGTDPGAGGCDDAAAGGCN